MSFLHKTSPFYTQIILKIDSIDYDIFPHLKKTKETFFKMEVKPLRLLSASHITSDDPRFLSFIQQTKRDAFYHRPSPILTAIDNHDAWEFMDVGCWEALYTVENDKPRKCCSCKKEYIVVTKKYSIADNNHWDEDLVIALNRMVESMECPPCHFETSLGMKKSGQVIYYKTTGNPDITDNMVLHDAYNHAIPIWLYPEKFWYRKFEAKFHWGILSYKLLRDKDKDMYWDRLYTTE